jgi:hypothetical protein
MYQGIECKKYGMLYHYKKITKGGTQEGKPPNVKHEDGNFVIVQFSMMSACNTMGTSGTRE